jgi:hypothetical protein
MKASMSLISNVVLDGLPTNRDEVRSHHLVSRQHPRPYGNFVAIDTYRIGGKRQHCVECNSAANIDERDDTHENSSCDDGIGWHVGVRTDLER